MMSKFIIELPDNMRWSLNRYQTIFELNNLGAVLAKIIDQVDFSLTRPEYMENAKLMLVLIKTLAPLIMQMARAIEIEETEAEHVLDNSGDSVRADLPSL